VFCYLVALNDTKYQHNSLIHQSFDEVSLSVLNAVIFFESNTQEGGSAYLTDASSGSMKA